MILIESHINIQKIQVSKHGNKLFWLLNKQIKLQATTLNLHFSMFLLNAGYKILICVLNSEYNNNNNLFACKFVHDIWKYFEIKKYIYRPHYIILQTTCSSMIIFFYLFYSSLYF
jgi:hypothetical protein